MTHKKTQVTFHISFGLASEKVGYLEAADHKHIHKNGAFARRYLYSAHEFLHIASIPATATTATACTTSTSSYILRERCKFSSKEFLIYFWALATFHACNKFCCCKSTFCWCGVLVRWCRKCISRCTVICKGWRARIVKKLEFGILSSSIVAFLHIW